MRSGSKAAPQMPEHDTEFHLNQQTKRRRVDIGVKRIVCSAATSTRTASAVITVTQAAKSTVIFDAMSSHHNSKQDVLDCQGAHLKHQDSGEANVLRKLLKRASSGYEDNMIPFYGNTTITKLKSNKATRGTVCRDPVFSRKAEPELSQEDTCSNSSQENVKECVSQTGQIAGTHLDFEWLNEEHLQAKRARVENIIRGMNHSPNAMAHSVSSGKDCKRNGEGETEVPAPSFSPREGNRENKRKQKLPQQQQSFQQLVPTHKQQKVEERRQLKLQLEDMQKQLRQLQEKFFQIYDSTDSEADGGNVSEDSAQSDGILGHGGIPEHLIQNSVADRTDNEMADSDPECVLDDARVLLSEQVLLDGEMAKWEGSLRSKALVSMHEVGKHLAETLKQELNSAMSQVIDTVVNVFSKPPRTLLQVFPSLPVTQDHFAFNGDNPNFHTANQRLQCFGDVIFPRPFDSIVGVPLPSSSDQTEALPLVVRKSASEHHQSTDLGAQSGHPHHTSSLSGNTGFISPSFRHPFSLPLMGYSFQGKLGASSIGYPSKDTPDLMDLSRETSSSRQKMATSHHLMHNSSCSPVYSESTAEGLSLIKSDCADLQDMSDISPHSGSTISLS